ncbi:palmitoyltransferase ZDHHC21 isoform X2 [Maylandia zebra]|uniref:palmitoyltransferase ZDHHC21 isoform X2 n=1 Tax=Astatotilapia calliptera TaxID=8154 RepID=UPI000E400944|nr:palmitoyltransferase ZDHHC21 isoform X2 [Astatotilapia calliptera]XP_039868252.1 palmitoyltransferase ZDHHC21 isoform X2 [Simochromis diagramma]
MKLRLHFVVDPMGWLCISVVFGIWLYNTFFVPKLVLFPHYNEGHIPWAIVVCYYIASGLCLAALFRASTADPGRLPADPHIPHAEREHWELCNKCNLMRPKRSHHCSRCGHCVRRMDHHCPWINNCVGEDNHWLFLQLCFYAQVLSLFTLVLDFCQYYYFQPLTGLDQDMTTIEKMAHFSNETYGAKRSWQWALAEVCGTRWKLLWLIPLRSRQPLNASHQFRSHV